MLNIIGLSPLMDNASNMHQYLTLTRPATAQEITRAQAIVGTLLYNAHAVDPTLLVPLSALASQLSTATSTETTINAVSHLLDYCSSHPESSINYFCCYFPIFRRASRSSYELSHGWQANQSHNLALPSTDSFPCSALNIH
jgi:hypothetical protein